MENKLSKSYYKRLKKYIICPSKTDYTLKSKTGHKFSNNIIGKFVNTKFKIILFNKHHKYSRTFKNSKQFFNQLSKFDTDGTVRTYFILNNFNENTLELPLNTYEGICKLMKEVNDIIQSIGLGDLMH